MCYEQLVELLGTRIKDRRLLWLIGRFLKAGVMIEGIRYDTTEGVAQGSVLSPLLANVYLHYVLDQWFERHVRPRMRGAAYLIRYADDFICAFQYESDARRFQDVLRKRLSRFSLELAEEKTKLLRFGRFAELATTRSGEGAPGTFDFLGFTHYCGHSRAGKFKLKWKTAKKKFRVKLRELKGWFRTSLMAFRKAAIRMTMRWLRRRSQTTFVSWQDFLSHLTHHPIATPRKLKNLIASC